MKKNYLIGLVLCCSLAANSQVYNFTTAGISGQNGPTQMNVDAAYTATTLDGMVTITTQGIQEWVVPASGNYLIEVYGSAGGTNAGYDVGNGAYMSGEFSLTSGTSLSLIVGQLPDMTAQYAKGGGGGSFVWETVSTTPLIIAGGGGGASNTSVLNPEIIHASSTTAGGFHTTAVAPGEGGAVTDVNWAGGGGAGWNSNGAGVNFVNSYAGGGGIRPLEGGLGGYFNDVSYVGDPYGGFGGGGGSGVHMGGAGGGYTGGEGGGYLASVARAPGGGGSYNTGANQTNTDAANTGEGYIIITALCDMMTTTVSSYTICNLDELTLSAVSTNGGNVTWDLGVINNVPFVLDSSGVVVFTATSDFGNDCGFTAEITVLELPDFSLTAGNDYGNNDGGVYMTINGGLFPFTFDWDTDGTGDFDDTQNITGLAAGTYTVVVEHGNGCTATDSATVLSFAGLVGASVDFNVYPNPTSSNVVIAHDGQFNYSVTDVLGQKLFAGTAFNSQFIDLSNFSRGTYFVKITADKNEQVVKVIKE